MLDLFYFYLINDKGLKVYKRMNMYIRSKKEEGILNSFHILIVKKTLSHPFKMLTIYMLLNGSNNIILFCKFHEVNISITYKIHS